MIAGVSFAAEYWPPVAAGTLLVVVALAALEWRRPAPMRGLRMLLITAAVLALGAIGLRPVRDAVAGSGRTLVLVASHGGGSTGDLVSRGSFIADSIRAGSVVLRDTIPGIGWLRLRHPRLDTLYLVGGALGGADRRAAAGLTLVLDENEPPGGIDHAAWTRDAAVGRPVEIAGRIRDARPGSWVFMDGPGTRDSVRIDSTGAFTLSARPSAAGRHEYVIGASLREGAVAETLGVAVASPVLPRIMVLESHPSFETRHLKRWLGEQGARVSLRSRTSAETYRYEHVNQTEQISLARLTSALLAQFDVVVSDGATLARLSGAERAALRSAVADSGLGLLLRADDTLLRGGGLPGADFFVAAPLQRLGGPEQGSVRLSWANDPRRRETGAVPAAAWALIDAFGSDMVASDEAGRGVVGRASRGAGRVVLTVVSEPGRWLLSGDPNAFALYWTRLLDELAGSRSPWWTVAQAGPLIEDEPVELVLENADSPATAAIAGPDGTVDSVYLAPDPVDESRLRGAWWPRTSGWHRLEGGGAATDLHVSSGTSWRPLQETRRIAGTRRIGLLGGAAPGGAASMVPGVPRPIGAAPFFALFLLSMTGLWVLDRRHGARPAA